MTSWSGLKQLSIAGELELPDQLAHQLVTLGIGSPYSLTMPESIHRVWLHSSRTYATYSEPIRRTSRVLRSHPPLEISSNPTSANGVASPRQNQAT